MPDMKPRPGGSIGQPTGCLQNEHTASRCFTFPRLPTPLTLSTCRREKSAPLPPSLSQIAPPPLPLPPSSNYPADDMAPLPNRAQMMSPARQPIPPPSPAPVAHLETFHSFCLGFAADCSADTSVSCLLTSGFMSHVSCTPFGGVSM